MFMSRYWASLRNFAPFSRAALSRIQVMYDKILSNAMYRLSGDNLHIQGTVVRGKLLWNPKTGRKLLLGQKHSKK